MSETTWSQAVTKFGAGDRSKYAMRRDFVYRADVNARSTAWVTVTYGNLFISYLCQLFFRHVVGQALQNVSY